MSSQAEPGGGADSVIDRFLPYTPSPAAHYLFAALYLALSAIFFARVFHRRTWWAACLPIGALFEGIGFINRKRFHDTVSMGLYLSGDLFVLAAPVAYLAFNYIVFGRLAATFTSGRELTLLKPRHLKVIFVWSDVLTFFVQLAGGFMKIVDAVAELGTKITLIGLILQLASYLVFMTLLWRFHSRTKRHWAYSGRDGVGRLLLLLWSSSAFIVVRGVYRVIELSGGLNSPLAKNQACFFILDATPLVFAIAGYTVFWPPAMVPLEAGYLREEESSEMKVAARESSYP